MKNFLKMGFAALATLMSSLMLFAAVVMENEPNNTLQSAQPVILGDSIQGLVSSDTDIDYFKYTLSEGTYMFYFTYPNGNPGFEDWVTVVDVNGIEFPHACYDVSGQQVSYIKICNATTAFVKVHKNATSGLTNKPYQIKMVADPDDPKECNDDKLTARVINDPGVYTGKMPVKNDPDVLKINSKSGIFGVAINTPLQPSLAFSLELYQGNNPIPIATTTSGYDLNYNLPANGVYYLSIKYALDTMSQYPYQVSMLYTPDTCNLPTIGVVNVQKSGKTVTLNTIVQNQDSLSINWGDGTFSDSLTHTYTNNGNYTISIAAINSCGVATATTTAYILTARFRLVPVENVVPGTPVKMALVCEEGEFQAATLQFTFVADASKVQISGVLPGTLNTNNLQKNTDLTSFGYGRVAGNFNPNGSETVSQGDTVLYLLINTIGAVKGDSVAVDLNGSLSFVFGAFILGSAEEIDTDLTPGSITFVKDVPFKVGIKTPTFVPVSNVKVTFTSADTTITAFTDVNGLVDIILPYSTQYTVTCQKDTVLLNGISPVDAFKINRAIVLLNNNGTTAYSYIAADFDCSSSINTLDPVKILQYIVGLIPTAPCAQLEFIDAAHVFLPYATNAATYFNYPTQVIVTNPNTTTGADAKFICVVRGDYDHNANPGLTNSDLNDRGLPSDAKFSYSVLEEDGKLKVRLSPETALEIASGAFTLGYDTDNFRFQELTMVQSHNATVVYKEIAPGKINLAFMNTVGENMSLLSDMPFIELTFNVVKSPSMTFDLSLLKDAIEPEISDNDGNLKSVAISRASALEVQTNQMFRFYPNPTQNDLLVSLPEPMDANLVMVDANGRTVFSQIGTKVWQMVVPTDQLSNGVYTCRLSTNGQTINRKIVVAH
jgi:PKD repeat protein